MATTHKAAHAAPKPQTVQFEYTMRHADGKLRRYIVVVDPHEVCRTLAPYAMRNAGRTSKAVGGGVKVQFVGEVAPRA